MKKFKYILPLLFLCLLFVPLSKPQVAYAASESVQAKVFGSVSHKVQADQADCYFTVQSMGNSETEAKDNAVLSFNNFNSKLSELGLNLCTNNFSVRAKLDCYNDNVVGYVATLSCNLYLNDLSMFNQVLDLATNENVKLNYLNYYSSTAEQEYVKALVKAKNKAVENAKILLGGEINLLKVEEISSFYTPCLYRSLSSASEELTLNPEIEISATVQIKCETI